VQTSLVETVAWHIFCVSLLCGNDHMCFGSNGVRVAKVGAFAPVYHNRTLRTMTWQFSFSVKPTLCEKVSRMSVDECQKKCFEENSHKRHPQNTCITRTPALTNAHPPLSFLQAGCPSCRTTNSVKALKALHNDNERMRISEQLADKPSRVLPTRGCCSKPLYKVRQ